MSVWFCILQLNGEEAARIDFPARPPTRRARPPAANRFAWHRSAPAHRTQRQAARYARLALRQLAMMVEGDCLGAKQWPSLPAR